MVGSRTLTALVGFIASIGLSVLLYIYTGSMLFFLFLPFIPFFFVNRNREDAHTAKSTTKECSRCGFTTRQPEFEYCPRDGSRLYEQETLR